MVHQPHTPQVKPSPRSSPSERAFPRVGVAQSHESWSSFKEKKTFFFGIGSVELNLVLAALFQFFLWFEHMPRWVLDQYLPCHQRSHSSEEDLGSMMTGRLRLYLKIQLMRRKLWDRGSSTSTGKIQRNECESEGFLLEPSVSEGAIGTLRASYHATESCVNCRGPSGGIEPRPVTTHSKRRFLRNTRSDPSTPIHKHYRMSWCELSTSFHDLCRSMRSVTRSGGSKAQSAQLWWRRKWRRLRRQDEEGLAPGQKKALRGAKKVGQFLHFSIWWFKHFFRKRCLILFNPWPIAPINESCRGQSAESHAESPDVRGRLAVELHAEFRRELLEDGVNRWRITVVLVPLRSYQPFFSWLYRYNPMP